MLPSDPLVIKELQRESEKLSEQVAELQTKLKELMGKPDVPFRQPIFTDDKPTAVPSEGSRKDDTQNKRFSFAQFCKADINAHSVRFLNIKSCECFWRTNRQFGDSMVLGEICVSVS